MKTFVPLHSTYEAKFKCRQQETAVDSQFPVHLCYLSSHRDPNNVGESVWSPFTETSRGYLMLDTNAPRMVTGQKATECAFWDNYVPALMNKTGGFVTLQ